VGNWGFITVARLFFGGRYSDLCYGYNAFWSWVLPFLDLDGDGFEIETMMNVRALQAGLKVVEVPSFEAERIHSESNLRSLPDGWRVLKTLVRERLKQNVVTRMAVPPPIDAESLPDARVGLASPLRERSVGGEQ
jgi:hypothetical protein